MDRHTDRVPAGSETDGTKLLDSPRNVRAGPRASLSGPRRVLLCSCRGPGWSDGRRARPATQVNHAAACRSALCQASFTLQLRPAPPGMDGCADRSMASLAFLLVFTRSPASVLVDSSCDVRYKLLPVRDTPVGDGGSVAPV